MNIAAPFFTVLTPTFNRAHTLGRVHRSLQVQTFRDFEWVIVDDGSSDDTSDLVARWSCAEDLNIRYFRQVNRGKHVAFNRGVREARGYLCLALDSDDACLPHALETLHAGWLAIPSAIRDKFAGIASPCLSEGGDVLGGSLPHDTIDGRSFEVLSRLRRNAEMWLLYRTDVLRAYPFPEFPGERFVPEGLVWNRIGMKYLMRFINKPLRVYYESPDSLSRSTVQIRAGSPKGTLTCYGEAMELPVRFALRLRAAINLCRFAVESGCFSDALPYAKKSPALAMAALVPGLMLAWRDQRIPRDRESL